MRNLKLGLTCALLSVSLGCSQIGRAFKMPDYKSQRYFEELENSDEDNLREIYFVCPPLLIPAGIID